MRKINIDRLIIIFLFVATIIGFCVINNKIDNLITKPIEMKKDYWYDTTEIPLDLIEEEVLFYDKKN